MRLKFARRFDSLGPWALASALAAALAGASTALAADEDFDRLDGKGASGKKVDVIEWEGNLEIHVYPAGSLKGLGLKLDKKQGKSVMVISYRFDSQPARPLIRRAILGIDLREGFRAYKDTSVVDYDKIIVSNNVLSEQVAEYKLEPEPKQLYPDGHPALAKAGEPAREPASEKPRSVEPKASVQDEPKASVQVERQANVPNEPPERPELDEHGTIKPFFSK